MSQFNRYWKRVATSIAAVALVAAFGACEVGQDGQSVQTTSADLTFAAAEPAALEKPCNPEDVADLIDAIEALTDWSFPADCNSTKNPNYCKIVEATFESLEQYLEDGENEILEAEIKICIKNEKHPNGYSAYMQTTGPNQYTITHYVY